MTIKEDKQYQLFRTEVLKYEGLGIDFLWMLIRRYTTGYMGRRFLNDTLKTQYYRFWIKRLEGEGTIENIKGTLSFKIIKDITTVE
jgi:hypothetical protein